MTQNLCTVYLLDENGGRRQSWPLAGKTTYCLGRGRDNDLVLSFSWVSRKHAMIQVESNGICNLIDLGSSNGTYLNGRRIYAPTPLRTGDRLEIGRTALEFEQTAAPAMPVASEEEDLDDRTVAFVQKETVTILICDIHDYTGLSRRLGAEVVSELLRRWTGLADRQIVRHGGTVDKFIGDAALAVFRNGDRPETIRRALAATLAIAAGTRELGSSEQPALTIGAAINTGEAVLGNMGVDGHRDFTVVGDAVNLAFRLEELTSRHQGLDLLIGADTAAALPGANESFRELSCPVKGREKPVLAYGCSFSDLRAYLQETPRD